MFVAVQPPEDVVEDLDAFLGPRREAGPRLRWTLPESWHLTLAFMPEVPERSLDDLEERLGRAARKRTPFELTVGGGGAFPNPGRAKVLYAGVAGEADALEELRRLATGARAAAAKAGAEPNGATFRAHVTLARTGRPVEATRWLRVLDGWRSRPFTVDEAVLVRSHLGEGPRGRPRYESVAAYPLGPGPRQPDVRGAAHDVTYRG